MKHGFLNVLFLLALCSPITHSFYLKSYELTRTAIPRELQAFTDSKQFILTVTAQVGKSQTAAKMLIQPFTNYTFVGSCNDLVNYNCNPNDDCKWGSNDKKLELPLYTIDGKHATVPLTVGNGYGNNSFPILFANSCTDLRLPSSIKPHGAIGFGLVNGKNTAFTKNIFSFYFGSDGVSGELIFGDDYFKRKDLITTITSLEDDWSFDVNGITYGTTNINFIGEAYFDPSRTMTAIPSYAFTNIISAMNQAGVTCDSSNIQCTFSGDISSLPSITFNIKNGATLTMTPSEYLIPQGSNYTLHIIGTSIDPTKSTYLTVKETASDDIILGVDMMAKYYLVYEFDKPGQTITVYQANHSFFNSIWNVGIVAGAAVIVLLIITVVVICKCKKAPSKNDASFEVPMVSIIK
jgi:Eukaryotic aspartyl protease.